MIVQLLCVTVRWSLLSESTSVKLDGKCTLYNKVILWYLLDVMCTMGPAGYTKRLYYDIYQMQCVQRAQQGVHCTTRLYNDIYYMQCVQWAQQGVHCTTRLYNDIYQMQCVQRAQQGVQRGYNMMFTRCNVYMMGPAGCTTRLYYDIYQM